MHCTTPEHVPHSLSRLEKKVIVCFPMSVLKENTPYGKTFHQILWGIHVKATHNCSGSLKEKEKKEKKRKYNGLKGTQKSLSRPDFLLGLPLNTEILTLGIVTCKLLLLLLFAGYFFFIIFFFGSEFRGVARIFSEVPTTPLNAPVPPPHPHQCPQREGYCKLKRL